MAEVSEMIKTKLTVRIFVSQCFALRGRRGGGGGGGEDCLLLVFTWKTWLPVVAWQRDGIPIYWNFVQFGTISDLHVAITACSPDGQRIFTPLLYAWARLAGFDSPLSNSMLLASRLESLYCSSCFFFQPGLNLAHTSHFLRICACSSDRCKMLLQRLKTYEETFGNCNWHPSVSKMTCKNCLLPIKPFRRVFKCCFQKHSSCRKASKTSLPQLKRITAACNCCLRAFKPYKEALRICRLSCKQTKSTYKYGLRKLKRSRKMFEHFSLWQSLCKEACKFSLHKHET